MEQNFRRLNILLTISLFLFIVPFLLIPYEIVAVPENVKMPIFLIAVLSGLLYYVFLGILASKKNRSVIKWVGLTIIFSPFGYIISYSLILTAKPLEKKG